MSNKSHTPTQSALTGYLPLFGGHKGRIVVSATGKSVIGRPRESSGPQSPPASELVLRTDFACAQVCNSLESSSQAIDPVQVAYLRYLCKTRVAEDTFRGSDGTSSPAKSSAARS